MKMKKKKLGKNLPQRPRPATPASYPLSNSISTDYDQAGLKDGPENREVRDQALLPFPAHCDKELTHHPSLWARGPTDSHKARASWDGIHPILTLSHQHTVGNTEET